MKNTYLYYFFAFALALTGLVVWSSVTTEPPKTEMEAYLNTRLKMRFQTVTSTDGPRRRVGMTRNESVIVEIRSGNEPPALTLVTMMSDADQARMLDLLSDIAGHYADYQISAEQMGATIDSSTDGNTVELSGAKGQVIEVTSMAPVRPLVTVVFRPPAGHPAAQPMNPPARQP